MKPNRKYFIGRPAKRFLAGFALMDVVLAMAVFAFGMLALVQLQGSLAKASADANARTTAANVAEEIVERLRAYRKVAADPTEYVWGYVEMVDGMTLPPVTRGGITYTRDIDVSDFWWYEDESVAHFIRTDTSEPPEELGSLANSDFKLIKLDVSWGSSDDFYVSDTATADLESGSITIYEIIPSSPPSLGAVLLSPLDGDKGPVVLYNPGDTPKIIALQLDDKGTKFKESTSIQPLKYKSGTETWFDVVTYSMAIENDDVGEFVRREEFVVVDCLCEKSDSTEGFTPTLWNGESYTEGRPENKPTGFDPLAGGGSIDNPDSSPYCSSCCRDHHDADTAGPEDVYSSRKATPGGDHPHYFREDGELYASDLRDGQYHEQCRLVRKDGFMKVTKDVDQGTLIAFPEGFLSTGDGAFEYSAYVLQALNIHYGTNKGDKPFPQPDPYDFSARMPEEAVSMPTGDLRQDDEGNYIQQMRARAVYPDYLSADAEIAIKECFPSGGGAATDKCPMPFASSPLEMYPFFDLQMTWLADWFNESDSPIVSVEPEGFEQVAWEDFDPTADPTYDRGLLTLLSNISGEQVNISVNSEKGNDGLALLGVIDHNVEVSVDNLWFDLNPDSPIPPVGKVISGEYVFSNADRNEIGWESVNASCGTKLLDDPMKTSTMLWSCILPSGSATLTLTGLVQKIRGKAIAFNVCTTLEKSSPDPDSVTLVLPAGGGENVGIRLSADTCP